MCVCVCVCVCVGGGGGGGGGGGAWTSDIGRKIRVTGDCNCLCDRKIFFFWECIFGNGISGHEIMIFIVPVNITNHARTKPKSVWCLQNRAYQCPILECYGLLTGANIALDAISIRRCPILSIWNPIMIFIYTRNPSSIKTIFMLMVPLGLSLASHCKRKDNWKLSSTLYEHHFINV